MALPDVSFTNNLGTITFKRCIIGVTDSWEWAGRGVKHVKSISISGQVKQGGTDEKLDGILTQRGTPAKNVGDTGTLTLPWTTINHVKLAGIEWSESKWTDFTPVDCQFIDDTPYNNRYTWTLFGQTLFNPRITIPVASRPLLDDYPQMRWAAGFIAGDPRSGCFTLRGNEKNMDFSVSGTIRVTDVALPTNLLNTLQMRVGQQTVLRGTLNAGGYPVPFNLGEAIPELRDDLNLAHCIVIGGQLQWYVEQQQASINLSLLAPPQKLVRT
jgi:hypothetical protein